MSSFPLPGTPAPLNVGRPRDRDACHLQGGAREAPKRVVTIAVPPGVRLTLFCTVVSPSSWQDRRGHATGGSQAAWRPHVRPRVSPILPAPPPTLGGRGPLGTAAGGPPGCHARPGATSPVWTGVFPARSAVVPRPSNPQAFSRLLHQGLSPPCGRGRDKACFHLPSVMSLSLAPTRFWGLR